ncbi:MAG: SdrD B-like domain-containing protein, partial [Ectothiorhodospiraceae bacterium]|nr:SdrD B-like domain-containing protein [Ectothiorhodospiraceae bacterium]
MNGSEIVWSNVDITSRCLTFTLRVTYPAGDEGQQKQNQAEVVYTPWGQVQTSKSATASHTLGAPNPGYEGRKTQSDPDNQGNVDQDLSYSLQCRNQAPYNVPLNTCVVTDDVPPNLNVANVNSGGGTLEFWKAANGAACPASGDAPVNAGSYNGTVAALGGIDDATEYVCRIRVTWTDVPVLTNRTASFGGKVCNSSGGSPQACKSGANQTLPFDMINTASFAATDGNDVAVGGQTPSRTFTIREPGLHPTFAPVVTKTRAPSGDVNPGGSLTFTLAMRNDPNYSSPPEQVNILNPVFADLLPAQVELDPAIGGDTIAPAAVTASGALPASCTQDPVVRALHDYDGIGRTMIVFDWSGTGCEMSRDEGPRTFQIATRIKDHTPQGSLTNRVAFLGSGNDGSHALGTNNCSTSVSDPIQVSGSGNFSAGIGVDGRTCQAGSVGFAVAKFFDVGSRKGVKGQLDGAFGYNDVDFIARTVPGGAVTWQLEIENSGNVALDLIDLIDILPFNAADGGASGANRGVGTNSPAFLGSTWSPRFVDSLQPSITLQPSGDVRSGKIWYTNAPNPCRSGTGGDPRILSPLPGNTGAGACNPMSVLADGVPLTDPGTLPVPGAAAEWSTVLPAITSQVSAFRIQLQPTSATIPAGETIRIEYLMQAPFDAPHDGCGGGANNTAACADVAWNSFGFQYHEVGANASLLNGAAPSSVGVIVEQPPAGSASYGNYVWYDTDHDGIQNETATNGIDGVLVELLFNDNGDVSVVGSQRTGRNPELGPDFGRPGYYLFQGLPPTTAGQCYSTRFYAPDRVADDDSASAWRATQANAGGNDALDSDGVPAGSHATTQGDGSIALERRGWVESDCVTLSANQHFRNADQGFWLLEPRLSLGNRVWYDVNNDGIDNDGASGEPGSGTGIADVTVQLWAADANGDPVGGAPLAEQSTNATGHYLFTGLEPGDYLVVIPVDEFAPGRPLRGLYSSGTLRDAQGNPSETGLVGTAPVVGRVDAASALDVSDHGLHLADALGPIAAGSVVSTRVALQAPTPADEIDSNDDTSKNAPRGKTQGLDDPAVDDHSDLTLDFGFFNIEALEIVKTAYAGHSAGANCAAGVDPLIIVDPVPGNPKAVTWCFSVTNHGAVALDNPVFTDAELGISAGVNQHLVQLVAGTLPLTPGASAIWYVEAVHSESLTNDVHLTMTLAGEDDPAVAAEDEGAVFAYVFDPPFGIKIGELQGETLLGWRMVWVNDAPVTANDVLVTDAIPAGTTYVPGSLQCLFGPGSTSTLVGNDPANCAYDPVLNRIVVRVDLAPDPGVTPADVDPLDPFAIAANALVIDFQVTAIDGGAYQNEGELEWTPPGESEPWRTTTDAPGEAGGPTEVLVPV